MKNIIKILIISILITSCQWQGVYELPFEKAKLVVNGVLSANQPAIVYIGSNWAATGAIPADPSVKTAKVMLYEEGILIGVLQHTTNGLYTLKDYLLKPAKSYVIKVTESKFDNAESKPVKIPAEASVSKAVFDSKTVMPSISYTSGDADYFKARLLSIDLYDELTLPNYYGINIKALRNGYEVTGNLYDLDIGYQTLNKANSSCYTLAGLYESPSNLKIKPFEYMILYNNACFTNKDKKINLVRETFGTVQNPNKLENAQANVIEASVCTLSEEYYQFIKNYKVLEGLDNAFFEPLPNYTNVVGGLGVVMALNKKTYIFKI